MTEVLAHRGPDGVGLYEDPHIALGHRRLSIIDLEGGKQPIPNEDGSIQLICNGEIYNSPELRKRLEARGHRFRTSTDVEVILHLYEEYGAECVRELRGMFAFAIWDRNHRRLLLARDHLGQKPLFFAQIGRDFVFASEIKSLLASGLIKPAIDLEALWHYVSLRYIPRDLTLFKGIQKLEAATSLVYESERIVVRPYWDIDFCDKYNQSLDSMTDQLDHLLRETVGAHLLSDVTVGTFLSGGIDSSTVTSIASGLQHGGLPAFSIGVDDQGFNELPYARTVASHCGVSHHEQVVHANLIELLPKMNYFMEEPADPFAVGMYLASEVASKYVKVVLSGDGGDESFAGYDRYSGQKIVDLYGHVPGWWRRAVMPSLIRLVPETFGYKSLRQKVNWVNELSMVPPSTRYAESLTVLRFTGNAKSTLFTREATERVRSADSRAEVLRYFDSDNASSIVDKMLYTDIKTRLPDHLLALVDRMAMAHSLEVRPVFVDKDLVEFAARIPAKWKLHRGKLKYILKRVAERHIPREVVYREKQGFSFPIARWLRTDLQTFTRNLCRNSRFVESGVFNSSYIDSIVEQHQNGQQDHNYRIWILLNLEYWHRLFIEGQSIEDMREFTLRMLKETSAGG